MFGRPGAICSRPSFPKTRTRAPEKDGAKVVGGVLFERAFMDSLVLLVVVVVALVALEMLGLRAYRRHRARKEAAFTRENVRELYDDLQQARARCLTQRRAFEALAAHASAIEQFEDAAILKAFADGQRVHLSALEEFRTVLHAESVEAEPRSPRADDLNEALRFEAVGVAAWAEGFCRTAAARARVRGYANISKLYRQFEEVEQNTALLCQDISEEIHPTEPLSRCPSCGLVVEGRRPAFCTICTRPGFEFEDVKAIEPVQ